MAAVALPQYQVAVKKSRYLQMIALGDAVHKAEELYWLANGKYTSDITQLDLDVSVPRQPMQGFSINPTDPSVWMGMAGLPRYVVYMNHHPQVFYRGRRECRTGQSIQFRAANMPLVNWRQRKVR